MLKASIKRWLNDDRLIIYILAVAVLILATLSGLIGQVNHDSFSLIGFIFSFIASFFGQIFIISLLLQLSVKRPKLGGTLILFLFVFLALIFLPNLLTTTTLEFGERPGAFVGNPHLLALYLTGVVLYAVSGIMVIRTKAIE